MGSPADTWSLYTAIPGVVNPAGGAEGELITDGVLAAADLTVRCELRDLSRNRSVRRFPFGAPPGAVNPIDIPLITSPVGGGSTGGTGYDLVFDSALPAGGGLSRAVLFGVSPLFMPRSLMS